MKEGTQSGFTLIEVIIGLAILAVVSTAIYEAYGNVVQIVQASQYNSAALSIIEAQVETARNMRYEDVGTQGGVPPGKLAQTKTVTIDNTPFVLHTYVRNIDDPFDGTLGGTPNDTAPADYKLIELQVTCDTCTRYKLISMVTYVGPKNLESSSRRGNLFVRVFDASGAPVIGASVHVTNSAVSPAVDLTDITNNAGLLQLVDIATSSAGYHIVVTKNGYSGDQTYPPGNPPNPVKPDATVATQQLTISSLAIDLVSTLTVTAHDQFCQAVPGMDFLMTGGKLIGIDPDTPKYSAAQSTGATGAAALAGLEWDSYAIKPTDTTLDIAGRTASLSLTINPATSSSMSWLIASRSASALLVSVVDQGGVPADDATVQLTKAGFSATKVTDRAAVKQTDWSGGQFDSTSGQVDTSTLGTLTLAQVGGHYATSSQEWLVSRTFDMGTASTTFFDVGFNPTSQPPQTTLQIQLATNNDNATWNFVGPDGTAGSNFTTTGQTVHPSLSGKRYLRYKAYLHSDDGQRTPSLDDITIGFRSPCLVPGQAYLNGLNAGTYTLTVTKSGYQPVTASVSITNTWQQTAVTLQP